MTLAYAGVDVDLREVVLRDKPPAMLEISAKGTVPVLQLPDSVIDESHDIMHWAMDQHDPDGWRAFEPAELESMQLLVVRCDGEFKHWLDRYKYADRYPGEDVSVYRERAGEFLALLEQQLSDQGPYLYGSRLSYADVAVFPFLRQFAFVDKMAFDELPYPRVQSWLESLLANMLFTSVMAKHSQWQPGD